MNPKEIFNLTTPHWQIFKEVFSSLMSNVKFARLNENEFEYRGKHNNYEIGFGLINGNLDVDVFGFTHKKEWIELEPTDLQINEMKTILDKVDLKDIKEPDSRYVDYYKENGVNMRDFY